VEKPRNPVLDVNPHTNNPGLQAANQMIDCASVHIKRILAIATTVKASLISSQSTSLD
jgi:hypothetical protein